MEITAAGRRRLIADGQAPARQHRYLLRKQFLLDQVRYASFLLRSFSFEHGGILLAQEQADPKRWQNDAKRQQCQENSGILPSGAGDGSPIVLGHQRPARARHRCMSRDDIVASRIARASSPSLQAGAGQLATSITSPILPYPES